MRVPALPNSAEIDDRRRHGGPVTPRLVANRFDDGLFTHGSYRRAMALTTVIVRRDTRALFSRTYLDAVLPYAAKAAKATIKPYLQRFL